MKKPANAAAVRLQKFLAEAGLASRRKAEEIIQSGRVRVNGKVVTELGTKVEPGRDLVVVDGAPVAGLVQALADPTFTPRVADNVAASEAALETLEAAMDKAEATARTAAAALEPAAPAAPGAPPATPETS